MFDNSFATRFAAAIFSVTISAVFFAYAIVPASPTTPLTLGAIA